MFELGSSLRDARVRRGIELSRVAAATRIRMRYLQALEDERFELLPGAVYAKGFLRAYAEYLGLESQLFVDEYNARFNDDETPPAPPQLEPGASPARRYGLAIAVLLVALVGALVAWQVGGSSRGQPGAPAASASAAGAGASVTSQGARSATFRRGPTVRPVVASASLVLRATRGPCWLWVRRGSAGGRQLFQGTLEPGQWRRFAQGPLWVRIGAPWNLDARRAGAPLSLPQTVADVVVTATGVRTLATR
jgi:hypothetical protein